MEIKTHTFVQYKNNTNNIKKKEIKLEQASFPLLSKIKVKKNKNKNDNTVIDFEKLFKKNENKKIDLSVEKENMVTFFYDNITQKLITNNDDYKEINTNNKKKELSFHEHASNTFNQMIDRWEKHKNDHIELYGLDDYLQTYGHCLYDYQPEYEWEEKDEEYELNDDFEFEFEIENE
jgi:hypothetical protein